MRMACSVLLLVSAGSMGPTWMGVGWKATSNGARNSVTDIELKVHNVCWLALQLLSQGFEQRRMVWRLQRLLLQHWEKSDLRGR